MDIPSLLFSCVPLPHFERYNRTDAEALFFFKEKYFAKIYSCGGFNTPTLCVEIKGIESDCNTL